MCFSASASFIAGTSLSAVGVAALRNTKATTEQPLAIIPLLFGIQQITEYVPFAMGVLEAVRWRKRTLFAFEAAGIAVGLYLLYSIVTRPLVADVVGRHIVYASPHFYLVPVMVLYLAATCVSCFVSSHGFVKLFGVLSLSSFIAAYIVHIGALVSIWCFFAAILSVLIYLHLRFRARGGFPPGPSFPRAVDAL